MAFFGQVQKEKKRVNIAAFAAPAFKIYSGPMIFHLQSFNFNSEQEALTHVAPSSQATADCFKKPKPPFGVLLSCGSPVRSSGFIHVA